VTGPWRKPRKWNLPLTYEPKIPGVIDGTIQQTIRVGRKFRVGDLVSFHGWEGQAISVEMVVSDAIFYPDDGTGDSDRARRDRGAPAPAA